MKNLFSRFGKKLEARDGFRCSYCQRIMQKPEPGGSPLAATVDHVIPQARGGRTQMDNLVLACRSCNSKKRDAEILNLDCGG